MGKAIQYINNQIKTKTLFIFILLIAVFSSLLKGQEKVDPLNLQQKSVALRAARMVDVNSGTIVSNAVILIKGNRIVSAGSNLPIPPDAETIDLGNTTLLPGLIDAHTHILESFNREMSGVQNDILSITEMSMGKRVLLGSLHAREMLESGFTAVRDLGNSNINADVDLREAIDAGWIAGPRIFASARNITPVGGGMGRIPPDYQKLTDRWSISITGAVEARQAVRQNFYDGADLIKVYVLSRNVLSLEELQAIVSETHRVGRKVAAHAIQEFDTDLAAQAGVNSIEHGYEISDETLKMMADKKIFLVPTDHTAEHYMPDNIPPEEREKWLKDRNEKLALIRERLMRAFKIGVRIAAGSDSYYDMAGKTRGQVSANIFRAYAEAGLPPIEIIRAATINAATLIESGPPRFGTLEPGKYADIIAVDGNPLDDITRLEHVKFVMKNGTVFKR